MYSCVELYVYFKTLIALRVLLVFLYYELGLHSDKFTLTSMEIGILLKINKGHRKDDTLHTSKSEYFKTPLDAHPSLNKTTYQVL